MSHLRRILALLFLLPSATWAQAAPPTVENVSAQQRQDGSQLVDVQYDLFDSDSPDVHISAVASIDGGVTWALRVTTVQPPPGMDEAQFGPGIQPGPGRAFVWELGEDYPGLFCSDLIIRVVASDLTAFTRLFGGEGTERGRHLIAAADGGYLVVGSTDSYGAGGQDIWLLKTDDEGNEQWRQEIGHIGDDEGWHGVEKPGGGYLIVGTTDSWGFGEEDILLLAIDGAGEIVWARNYGDSHDDGHPRLALLPGGDILLGGSVSRLDLDSTENPYWHSDLYLARLDATGDPQWEVLLDGPGGFSVPYSAGETDDSLIGLILNGVGGITTASEYNSIVDPGHQWGVWIVELDLAGEVLGSDCPLTDCSGVSERHVYPRDLVVTPDGGFLLAGDIYWEAVGGWPFLYHHGELTWQRDYGELSTSAFKAVHICGDGSLIATGSQTPGIRYPPQVMVLRLSATGEILWLRVYDSWERSYGFDILECPDGGILVTGKADGDLLLMKTDADGNPAP